MNKKIFPKPDAPRHKTSFTPFFLRKRKFANPVDPSQRFKLTAPEVAKFTLYFVAFLLLATAKFEGGIAPFNLGLFVALLFCKENFFILSPIYALALFIVSPTLEGLTAAILTPSLFGLALLMHRFIKKPMKLLTVNIYAFLSQIPMVAIGLVLSKNIALSLVGLVLSQAFTYCAVVFCYAVLIRGLKYRFSADEVACSLVIILALSLGLFSLDIFGFKPFFVLAGFIIIASCYLFEQKVALSLCFVVGLGAGLDPVALSTAAAFLLCSICASIFIKSNVYFAGAAVILSDILSGIYFKAFGTYDLLHLIAFALGVGVFLLLPKKIRNHLLSSIGRLKENFAIKGFVNRNREEVCHKLKQCSSVFTEMQTLLSPHKGLSSTQGTKRAMAQEMVLCVCADCPKNSECFRSLAADTSVIFEKIIDASEHKDKITMLDIPTFLTSRCTRISLILDKANDLSKRYHETLAKREELSLTRELIGYQMAGVANMLDTLADELSTSVSFDSERERRLIEELSYHNIVASEVLVYTNREGEYELNLTIRQRDAGKKAIIHVVDKLLKCSMVKAEEKEHSSTGFVTVTLVAKPRYSISFGEAMLKKTESDKSGDTRSITKINTSKFMLALCDGMGSGEEACRNSETTMSMIEGFYRANFGSDMTLNLTNRLLALKNDDDFSALDLCVVDTLSGASDFIKLGGVESFLVRGDNVEVLSSSALPLGILDEVKPHIERKILGHGDMIVMISDGILEGLETEAIISFIKRNLTLNPQILAENLLRKATNGGGCAKDDSTVMVARIIQSR